MIKKSIKIIRGDTATIKLRALGDYTLNTAYFTIKENRELTSDRYVDLETDSGITAAYLYGYTTFTIVIPKANTQQLTFDNMVYDLVIDETTTLISGDVLLTHDVRTPSDGSATVNTYKYLRVKLEAGVATEEKSIGFIGTISYVFSSGTLTISSDTAADFPTDIFIATNQLDCNYAYVSDQEITITPNTGYGVLIIKITKDL